MQRKLFYSPKYAIVRFFLIFFGMVCVLFSWGKSIFLYEKPSVLFLIDSSFSMSVNDIQTRLHYFTSRLDVAKNLAKNLNTLGDIPIAIATFSRELTLELPFTNEKDFIDNVISGISVNPFGGGSDIHNAISRILDVYKNRKNMHIIILSDMETFDENDKEIPLPQNASLIFVGIGTKDGGPMLEGYTSNGQPSYRQFEGKNAVSFLDEKALKEWSKYFHSPYFILDFEEKIGEISEKISQNLLKNTKNNSSIWLFIGVAILFFGTIFRVYFPKKKLYDA